MESVASPRLYVIDTSSIIEPRRLLGSEKRAKKEQVYEALGALVDAGALMFPPQVFDELARSHDEDDTDDLAYEWAKQYKERASTVITTEQLFEAVRAVQEVVDNLVDYDKASPADDADPYVVGLALHMARSGKSVTVITQERNDRADKTSMGSACAMLEIPAMSLRAFLKVQRIWSSP